jgi:phi13 family phage major tail protein
MANKVKYGLKNVHYAIATIDELTNTATYGPVKPWVGAVNLSQEAQGDTTKFRADNIDYWVGTANNGYSGDFESALIPESFKQDVLGDIEDSNGVLVEDAGAKTVHFALMFQFEGDEHATRHVLYNCTATRPTVSGATTEETIEPQTETITINAVAIHNAALDKDLVKARCPEDNDQYATFFDAVYQPSGVATYVTVTFDTDGGTAIPDQQVRTGATVEKPADPTKTGYTFDGWYEEDTFTTVFNFASPVSVDTTIYAKFTSI